MLRFTLLLAGLLSLPACTWIPGFEDPELSVSPYVAFYDLHGETSMQSFNPGPVNNGSMDLRAFGFSGTETGLGAKAELGDGFSGLLFDYYRLDEIDRDKGTLEFDWGELDAGDMVTASAVMDEFRLSYIARFLGHEFQLRERPLDVGLGVGATIAHRRFEFDAVQDPDRLRRQKVEATDDGVVYAVGRARISWEGATLGADYGYSDGWEMGGDFEGEMQDLEIYLRYELENPRVILFGGWRRSELPISGVQDGLDYDMDLVLAGFQLGIGFEF